MQLSYSRINTWKQCPYKYKLQYIDKLTTLPNTDPTNALVLGTAMHLGIEKDVQSALDYYYSQFPIITDLHENEAIKLEILIPKVKALLPPTGEFETKIQTSDFLGFIDFLDDNFLIDFKYTTSAERYLNSPQIHLYSYFLGGTPQNLYYLIIPKTAIRQKKTEDLYQFRQRLRETLSRMEPQLYEVKYDPSKVVDWMLDVKHFLESEIFPKVENRFCDFCQYQKFCKEGIDYEMLPKNERIPVGTTNYMKGWIYGAPFSGKTTFLDSAPDPLNLNTDGNTKYVTMQRVLIRDEVTVTGRLTSRKFAWDILKGYIEDLEKGSDFKTIILDLVEDTREMCRLYMYDKLGIQHESDAGFGKGWDVIKTEYLSTMRRLLSLDYNIFLVSHEDVSKDLTKKSGDRITRIAPNIQEAIANKLAGMVDFVARVVVNDDESRTLSFKANEVTFGGGRLSALNGKEIPLDWNELVKAYEEAKVEYAKNAPAPVATVETPEEKKEEPETPESTPEVETPEEKKEEVETPEEAKPVRRRRKVRDE